MTGEEFSLDEDLGGSVLLEKPLREKNIQPICSIDELAANGLFESNEELAEFLDWLRVERGRW